ncbi:MAG: TetR/AcrR family transcriptional regulator C-terminal domain-containing protein [Oscillospiraceae bacterium]|nr:TetR/AcrR family transcriptional regulator C-terminal domain-containing protein [Oscillospiraceae bacterium]
MDRRQKKTRDAIFAAFRKLLERKPYENITVQEIIDEADIGRSTFYAHFETKDELLRSMCTDIFHHVFNQALPKEAEEDYSSGIRNLELKLGHVLYHLDEHRSELRGILSGNSARLFMSYFRNYLADLFMRYTDDFSADVPKDYLLNHRVGSFAETVKWWIAEKKEYSPEELAAFYIKLIEK